jgi:two-component system, response regulator
MKVNKEHLMNSLGTDKRTILLVEDNPGDEALTLRALKKNNIRNDVVIARDGVEALDYLFGTGAYAGRDTRELPELVLLDLKLPKVDGLEVLRSIRGDERTRLLPVIMLTSSLEDRDVVESYAKGCNSYVRKPIDFTEFSEAVRQLGLYWLVINVAAPKFRNNP